MVAQWHTIPAHFLNALFESVRKSLRGHRAHKRYVLRDFPRYYPPPSLCFHKADWTDLPRSRTKLFLRKIWKVGDSTVISRIGIMDYSMK